MCRVQYPHAVSASFGTEEAKPGDEVQVQVQTEGPAKVGLVAVDHSVFILAENRLNLEQVFAELERLYMQPQVELHEGEWMGGPLVIPGAKETFEDAGLIVLSNKRVPDGKEIEQPQMMFDAVRGAMAGAEAAPTTTAAAATTTTTPGGPAQNGSGDLAEVQRVRQFFPETWIWDETITDDAGRAILSYQAPDSITTWDLRAVALSPDKGLGIAEASLRVFQPFFLQADLPYSAIRGEEFPVKVALYNYLETPQQIQVEIEPDSWFELLGNPQTTVTVAGGDVGSAEFKIRPKTIGTQLVKVTARSSEAADAVNKSMIVEPEGVSRETVENVVLPAGQSRTLSLTLPALGVVPDSARAYVAVTGSLLAQTIEGLDQLLQMPFGCGEQNMILFAPDTFILNYLKGTRQLKPEIQAKAEALLVTGYQRELTYRRADGSFSAFGDQDQEGSLWLTAFVLKTFAQAKELTFIDEAVLSDAAHWITQHQQADGSFEAVGFVHHQEMIGGVQGKDALTAYVAVALLEAGQKAAADKAIAYLEGRLDAIDDPYGLALTTYALQLGGSDRCRAGAGETHGRSRRGRGRAALERRDGRACDRRSRAARRGASVRPGRTGRPRGWACAAHQPHAQPGHRGHRVRHACAHRGRRPGQRRQSGQVAGGAAEQPGRVRLDPGHGGRAPGPHSVLDAWRHRHRSHGDPDCRRRNQGYPDLARQLRRHPGGASPGRRAGAAGSPGEGRGRHPGGPALQPA